MNKIESIFWIASLIFVAFFGAIFGFAAVVIGGEIFSAFLPERPCPQNFGSSIIALIFSGMLSFYLLKNLYTSIAQPSKKTPSRSWDMKTIGRSQSLQTIFTICSWALFFYGIVQFQEGREHMALLLVPAVSLVFYRARQRRFSHLQEIEDQRNQIICPHCQFRGFVKTTPVLRKKGVSGGKATAALLTGGISLLAVGLSRKEAETEAHCSNCGSRWHY